MKTWHLTLTEPEAKLIAEALLFATSESRSGLAITLAAGLLDRINAQGLPEAIIGI